MSEEILNITLSKIEALVLFDLIARINESDHDTLFKHDAERKIFWKIEALLGTTLTEPLLQNYQELIIKARQELNDAY